VNKHKGIKILVADDNAMILKALSMMIERLTGITPDQASDGAEACDKATNGQFDLIFMDHNMPRMSGTEATERIRKLLPKSEQPRIVAISGSCSAQDQENYQSAGMDYFMSKPINLSLLKQLIETANPQIA